MRGRDTLGGGFRARRADGRADAARRRGNDTTRGGGGRQARDSSSRRAGAPKPRADETTNVGARRVASRRARGRRVELDSRRRKKSNEEKRAWRFLVSCCGVGGGARKSAGCAQAQESNGRLSHSRCCLHLALWRKPALGSGELHRVYVWPLSQVRVGDQDQPSEPSRAPPCSCRGPTHRDHARAALAACTGGGGGVVVACGALHRPIGSTANGRPGFAARCPGAGALTSALKAKSPTARAGLCLKPAHLFFLVCFWASGGGFWWWCARGR